MSVVRRQWWQARVILFLVLLGLLGACLPIPNLRLPLELPEPQYHLNPEEVQTDYVSLPGYPEPHTPEAYNKALYLRYYALLEPTDIILVLMPGIFDGAMALDGFARKLVASTPGLEVWTVDRRANLLEDRHVFTQSLQRRDPQLAYDYYVVNAGHEEGFRPLTAGEVSFMAYWGLEVHLRDLHVVVQEALKHAPKVLLGGHSLGTGIASYYLAFDFGAPQTSDPGYAYVDGLLLIDGALGRVGGYGEHDHSTRLGPVELLPSIAELEAGHASPYTRYLEAPLELVRSLSAALLATLAPDSLSPGTFVPFPATNLAVLGIQSDVLYTPSTVFSVTAGRAEGALFGGNLLAVILGGWEGIYSRTVVGVAPGHDYVSWTREGVPHVHTPLDAYARRFVAADTDLYEWYFPLRLLLDMGELDMHLASTPGFVPMREVPTPTLAVGGGRGLMPTLEDFSSYSNVRPGSYIATYILPGFTHSDMLHADPNPLVPLTQAWLSQLRQRR